MPRIAGSGRVFSARRMRNKAMDIHIPDGNNLVDILVNTDRAYHGDSDAVIPDADEAQLLEALAALERGDVEYVVLSDGARFMQAAGDARSGYVLEYNDGTDDAMMHAQGKITGAQVVDAMQAYLRRDDTWRSAFRWERITY